MTAIFSDREHITISRKSWGRILRKRTAQAACISVYGRPMRLLSMWSAHSTDGMKTSMA